MSTNLNLLSDSTFGTKMDTQNGILTDIKDGITGGSNAVTAGTPDADSVVQLKKKDPVSGTDVNVYPALAPASSLGRYLFPALPTQIDWTNWNSPECFICVNNVPPTQSDISTPTIFKRSFCLNFNMQSNPYILIRRDILDINHNLNAYEAFFNMIVTPHQTDATSTVNVIVDRSNNILITLNGTEYFGYTIGRNVASTLLSACTPITIIV